MNEKKLKPNISESGQSMIEFIVTFSFAIGVILLFINIAVNYTEGYVVHYATYMASRTYLTVDSNSIIEAGSQADAAEEARITFERFKPSLIGVPATGILAPGNGDPGFHINPYTTVNGIITNYLYVGAYSVRIEPLSMYKLISGDTKITYVSESYLGKEPTRADCYQRTCQAIMLAVTGNVVECTRNNTGYDFTVYDNGC